MAKGSKTARVAKSYSTGGIPGVSGAGSNFELGKNTIKNNGLVKGSYPGGKGAIGNGSGIPAGAK